MKNQDLFPIDKQGFWKNVVKHIEQIREIRIRVEKPIILYLNQKEVSLDKNGNFLYSINNGYRFHYNELQQLIDFWCMDSRYAFQEEIKKGFLTVKGGHRIGICGEVIYDTMGKLQSIKHISSVNIRIAHEIIDAAKSIMEYINRKDSVVNTLIISPPGIGKTTLLRDIVRMLSDGNGEQKGKSVAVVDERGEIAACYQGIPQLNVGLRTDILYGCDKELGMRMLLQSMAPEVIVVDELVSKREKRIIREMMGRGCAVIATMHGENKIDTVKYGNLYEGFQLLVFLYKQNGSVKIKLYQLEEKETCKNYWEQYSLLQDF